MRRYDIRSYTAKTIGILSHEFPTRSLVLGMRMPEFIIDGVETKFHVTHISGESRG